MFVFVVLVVIFVLYKTANFDFWYKSDFSKSTFLTRPFSYFVRSLLLFNRVRLESITACNVVFFFVKGSDQLWYYSITLTRYWDLCHLKYTGKAGMTTYAYWKRDCLFNVYSTIAWLFWPKPDLYARIYYKVLALIISISASKSCNIGISDLCLYYILNVFVILPDYENIHSVL